MANVNVTVIKTLEPNVASEGFTFTAAAASDNILVPLEGKDEQTTFIVTATAACNLTIKAGDSLQGVNDEIIAITAGKYHVFSLDSGRFKNIRGENAEKVVIVPSAACSIAVVETRV
ncbi:hypothetical protein LI177_02930 [bacterium 210820-DFI.6.37]|nr:hypothetical protein [bacterium 210820-DFI.6.37]